VVVVVMFVMLLSGVAEGQARVRRRGRRLSRCSADVPGLRREELAMLAGVSADYYARLEQGCDHHPSQPVLEGLARALRLDDDATAHLFALARAASHRPPGLTAAAERVRPELQDLLDA
jgi:transcriptional regulator with XRE-family HTH domain